MGVEPFNGNTSIQCEQYYFTIRIAFDKTIKFIYSHGVKTQSDFTKINLYY